MTAGYEEIGRGGSQISQEGRAIRAWKLIQRNPVSLRFIRGDTVLEPQEVRLEFEDTAREVMSPGGGQSSVRPVQIFGVRGHPDIPNTDIRRGDEFQFGESWYRVVDVAEVPGGIQADAERLR